MDNEKLRATAEMIDRIVSLMSKEWPEGKGLITWFYDAAREKIGEPLTYAAATGLMKRVNKGDIVVITTGARILPAYLGAGETDGAPGAAVLSRALYLGLRAIPVVVTEQGQTEAISHILRAAGFTVANLENTKRFIKEGYYRRMVACVLPFPTDDESAKKKAKELVAELTPKALIATEQVGMNEKGVIHTARGVDASDGQARVDYLYQEAKAQDIFTIGIGDNGNEIGYGLISDTVKKYKMYGAVCRCPCGAGIASKTATDVLIPTTVSNWGAYGVAAMLLVLVDKWQLTHSESMEERLLNAGVNVGLIHMGSEVTTAVDTFPLKANIAVVELIREIARQSKEFDFEGWEREGIYAT